MSQPPHSTPLRRVRWLAAALLLLAAPYALAAQRTASKSRGFVDGSAFADLAGEDSEIVEINLDASLLRALGRVDAHEEGLGEFASKLESVSAYVVGLENDPARVEKATRMVQEMEAKLEHGGWQRLAVVRKKEARVNVYIRNDEQVIDGLVVLVVDREESQVVFANIAGTIDLRDLGRLSETLEVPGIDALEDAVEQNDAQKDSSKQKKKKREPEP